MIEVPTIHATACEIKEGFFSKFSSCKEHPVGLCIYCGRAFCAEHGEVRSEGEEICYRKNCVAKRDDLVVHMQYRALVTAQNETGTCGIPSCQHPPDGQCSRCHAYFCLSHLDTRQETIGSGLQQVRQMATMCGHCWDRRPIWSRQ
jgi:hypothetical protein